MKQVWDITDCPELGQGGPWTLQDLRVILQIIEAKYGANCEIWLDAGPNDVTGRVQPSKKVKEKTK